MVEEAAEAEADEKEDEEEEGGSEQDEEERKPGRKKLVRGRVRPPESLVKIKPEPEDDDEGSNHHSGAIKPFSTQPSVPSPGRHPALPNTRATPPSVPSAPQIPSVATFLSSLPLPSLSRLTPIFSGLGLSSPSDLLQLSNGASEGARRARGRVLERVGGVDRELRAKGGGEEGGGLTPWERIVLEEELEEGWKRWSGQVAGKGEGAE